MTITFIPKVNNKEVEVAGYGKIKVRPYGAGEELQITKNVRELEELQKQAEHFLSDIKEKHQNDESKLTDEEKASFNAIQQKVFTLSNELNEIIRSTISSDDPSVAEKLFRELPIEEIRRLVTATIGGANAEAE